MKFILSCLPIFNHVFTPSLSLAYLKAYVSQYTKIEVKVLDLEYSYFSSSAIRKSTALYWDKIWFRDSELQVDPPKKRVNHHLRGIMLLLGKDPQKRFTVSYILI